MRVLYAWCICRCRSVRVPRVFGLKRFLSMLKFSRSPACRGRVSYTFRIRSMRVEDALNAFGTRSRNDSLRYMRVPILREIASVTCMRRALNVCCVPIERA